MPETAPANVLESLKQAMTNMENGRATVSKMSKEYKVKKNKLINILKQAQAETQKGGKRKNKTRKGKGKGKTRKH